MQRYKLRCSVQGLSCHLGLASTQHAGIDNGCLSQFEHGRDSMAFLTACSFVSNLFPRELGEFPTLLGKEDPPL